MRGVSSNGEWVVIEEATAVVCCMGGGGELGGRGRVGFWCLGRLGRLGDEGVVWCQRKCR